MLLQKLFEFGSLRGALRDRSHRGQKNNTSERDTTLLRKTLRWWWVLLLIRCSTFTLLSDVGNITHTCTQHFPSSVSLSIHHAPAEALTCMYRRCCFMRNGSTSSVVPFVEGGLWYHCWVTEESSGGPPTGMLSFFFKNKKLGIRFKNRLIWVDQSHRPLAEAPFKTRA